MKKLYFRDVGSQTVEPISCYIKKFTSDFYMGTHSHSYFEVMYASKGNFQLEIVEKDHKPDDGVFTTVTVHQGELVFIDAYLFHRLKIVEEDVLIYNVELKPCPPSDYDPFRINSVCLVNYSALIERTSLKTLAKSEAGYTVIPNLSQIDVAMRDLITASNKQPSNVEEACRIRTSTLLFFTEIAKSLTLLSQNSAHYVRKIYLYIKHHINQKISLDEIAEAVGYHKSYVATQFKKYTGKTIVQTVNEMRIAKCLRMLRDTSMSIAEIAERSGFPSYAQMAHVFQTTLKMSPSACRKAFLSEEVDYNSPNWSAIAVRMSEEDLLLDDEAFEHAFYKKDIKSKSKKLHEYS